MNCTLTIKINNKQGVWLSIVGFFKVMDCRVEIQNVLEQDSQRIITILVISKKAFTPEDMRRLEGFSENILSVQRLDEKVVADNTGESADPIVEKKQLKQSLTAVNQAVVKEPEATNAVVPDSRSKSLSKLVLVMTAVVVIAGLVITIYVMNEGPTAQTPNNNVVEVKSVTENNPEPEIKAAAIDQKTTADAEPVAPEEQRIANEISQLMADAEKHLSAKQLTEDIVVQAAQSYREVLQLNPDHTMAQRGLERVVNVYLSWVDQALARQDYQQAQNHLELARQVLPENQNITQAQQLLQRQQTEDLAKIEQQEQLELLLEKAKQALSAKRLSKPVNDNALAYYREVLNIDAGNKQALEGLTAVANSYLDLAEDAMERNDLDKAESYIDRSTEIEPENSSLLAIRKRFEQAKTEFVEIEKLLLKAQAALAAGRLHAPRNNNAAAIFQSVLVKDSNNKTALAGLQSVVAADVKLADKAIEQKQWVQAETYIQQAETVLPRSDSVKNARQRLLQAQTPVEVTSNTAPEVVAEPEAELNNAQVALEPKAAPVAQGQIAVIVHPGNPLSNISSSELRKIFSGQQQNWAGGGKVVVLNQSIGSNARARFYRAVLGAEPDKVFSQSFFGSSGKIPFVTKERGSDSSVRRFVRRNKRSIAYISLSNVDNSVKVLQINGEEPFSANYLLK